MEYMANNTVIHRDREQKIDELPWNEHPKFNGVFLKHLVTGADTEGKLSCHVVKIDPHCILEEHAHEGQWELHEVIQGSGFLLLAAKEAPFHPGQMAVIPEGTKHKVTAGKEGLVLRAHFFPALM
jgi:quercetin dioxygenase-like cupin family protein